MISSGSSSSNRQSIVIVAERPRPRRKRPTPHDHPAIAKRCKSDLAEVVRVQSKLAKRATASAYPGGVENICTTTTPKIKIAPSDLALRRGRRRVQRRSSSPAKEISSDGTISHTNQSWSCSEQRVRNGTARGLRMVRLHLGHCNASSMIDDDEGLLCTPDLQALEEATRKNDPFNHHGVQTHSSRCFGVSVEPLYSLSVCFLDVRALGLCRQSFRPRLVAGTIPVRMITVANVNVNKFAKFGFEKLLTEKILQSL